jgi:transformation/transcription domain-associated protein
MRDMIDLIRDSDVAGVFTYLIPTLLDALRSGEPSFRRDSQEYQFRRMLLEIVSRLPLQEHLRPFATSILDCMRFVLRRDNEDNVAVCCKIIMDHVKTWRSPNSTTADTVNDIIAIFLETLESTKTLIPELFSEDSIVIDPNQALPSMRSFKALSEISVTLILILQVLRAHGPAILPTVAAVFAFLENEAPVQRSARIGYEAASNDNIWHGMAPGIRNGPAYSDLVQAQIKVGFLLILERRSFTCNSDGFILVVAHASCS